MPLSDTEITRRKIVTVSDSDLIALPEKHLSRGVTSYGYDATLAYQFKRRKKFQALTIDPLNVKDFEYDTFNTDQPFEMLPQEYLLASTVERFKIPRDVVAIALGKSTYARCGLFVNVTPLEPEWEGHVTLELYNANDSKLRIYPGHGICQFIFLVAESLCAVSYADKKGKYQYQPPGVTLAKPGI
jgi:dCTP deaminase